MSIIVDVDQPSGAILAFASKKYEKRQEVNFDLLKAICMMRPGGKGETTQEYLDFLGSLPRGTIFFAFCTMQRGRGELTTWGQSIIKERSGSGSLLLAVLQMQAGRGMLTPKEYYIVQDLCCVSDVLDNGLLKRVCYLYCGLGFPNDDDIAKILDCCWIGGGLNFALLNGMAKQYRGSGVPKGEGYDLLLARCRQLQQKKFEATLLSGGSGYKRPFFSSVHYGAVLGADEVDEFIASQNISLFQRIRKMVLR